MPAPVAANPVAFVRNRHRRLLGLDRLPDAMLAALIIGAEVWRQQVGTNAASRPEPVPRSPVMTATRAADVLGISDRAVRKACTADRLDAELLNCRHCGDRADLGTPGGAAIGSRSRPR